MGLRAKTGISIEALSALGYAASVSGGDLDSLGMALAKMQKKLGAATGPDANDEAIDSFHKLGLSIQELRKVSPDKQFELIAEKIMAMQDPARRTAAAMDIFGKSGANLLPMMAGLAGKIAEAKSSGLIIKTEDAEAAKHFAHSLELLWAQVKRIAFGVGSALIPELEAFVGKIHRAAKGAIEWADANRPLIAWAAKLGTVVMVAGGALIFAGYAMKGAGVAAGFAAKAIAGVSSFVSFAGTGLAFLVSPLGLILAALTAGAVAWAFFTQSGQGAIKGLTGFFSSLLSTAQETLGGIVAALMSGQLTLAGTVAVAGLRVAMLQGMLALSGLIGGQFGGMLADLATQVSGGDLSGAWRTLTDELNTVWATFCEGVTAVFTTAIRLVLDVWEKATKKIAGWLLKNATEGGLLGKTALAGSGVNVQKEAENTRRLQAEQIAALQRQIADAEKDLADAKANGGTLDDGNGGTVTASDIEGQIAGLKEALAEQQGNPADFAKDAAAAAAQILGQQGASRPRQAGRHRQRRAAENGRRGSPTEKGQPRRTIGRRQSADEARANWPTEQVKALTAQQTDKKKEDLAGVARK